MIEHVKKMTGQISAIEDALKNIMRVGEVTGRDAKKMRVRVQFQDSDNVVSHWCQVLTPRAQTDHFYWLPDIGEMAVCIFLPFGREQGFVLGSAYNEKDLSPDAGDALVVENDDDIIIDSDKNNLFHSGRDTSVTAGGNLKASAGGDVSVTAGGKITISAGSTIDITAVGDITIKSPTQISVLAPTVHIIKCAKDCGCCT